jgi:tetratricopeptide (TPR) repeat protein
LNALWRFAREASRRSGWPALSAKLDRLLLTHFSDDRKLAAELEDSMAVAAPLAARALLPSADAVMRALALGEYPRAISIALYIDDQKLALDAYRQWLGHALRNGAESAPFIPAVEIIRDSRRKLDARGYVSFCRYAFDLAGDHPEHLRKLIFSARHHAIQARPHQVQSVLLEMEKVVGRVLLPEDDLKEWVLGRDAGDWKRLDVVYAMIRLAAADQVGLLERMLDSLGEDTLALHAAFLALRIMLTRPLNDEMSTRILAALKKRTLQQMGSAKITAMEAAQWVSETRLTQGMAAQNAVLIERLEDFLATADPDGFVPGVLKVDAMIATGRTAEALPLIVDAAMRAAGTGTDSAAQAAVADYIRGYANTIYPRHKAEVIERVRGGMEAASITPAAFAVLLALEVCDPQSDSLQLLGWLEGMAALHPDSESVLSALALHYGRAGLTDLQMRTLERLVAMVPAATGYRKSLFDLWRELDHPAAAVAAADGHLAELMNNAGANPMQSLGPVNDPMRRFPVIARAVEQVVALDAGGSVEQAGNALRSLFQMVHFDRTGGQRGEPVLQYEDLLELDWALPQKLRVGADDAHAGAVAMQIGAIEREEPVPDRLSRAGKFLEQVIEHEFAIEEFEALIRTLRPDDLERTCSLYGLLAQAYGRHGRRPAVLQRLTREVQAGTAGSNEVVLWLELLRQLPRAEVQQWLPLAEKTVGLAGVRDEYRQVLMARLYARADDEERAVDLYSAVLLSVTQASFGLRLPLWSPAGLYVDAQQHLSKTGLHRFAGILLRVVRPEEELADSGLYEQFLMWILERTPDAEPALARFRALLSEGTPAANWSRDRVIQVVGRLARLGQFGMALDILPYGLDGREPEFSADPAEYPEAAEAYRRMLGIGGEYRRYQQAQPELAAAQFIDLFPASADAWPGAQEWLRQATIMLPRWIEEGVVHRDLGLRVLALATLRQHRMGAHEDVLVSAQALSRLLAPHDATSRSTATLVIAVLKQTQAPLDTEMLRALIERKRLDVGLLAPVLQRVAQSTGAGEAVALGELALAYTQNDALLQLMKSLAGDLGRSELVRQITESQQSAAEARSMLEPGSDLQATQSTDQPLDGAWFALSL